MLRRRRKQIEVSGRIRTPKSCVEWTAIAIAGDMVSSCAWPSAEERRLSYAAATWDCYRDVTYVLELEAGTEFRSKVPILATSVCSEGVAVDLSVISAVETMRIVGVVVREPLDQVWSDEELLPVEGHRLQFSPLYADYFWLGLFVPESD